MLVVLLYYIHCPCVLDSVTGGVSQAKRSIQPRVIPIESITQLF